MDIQTWTTTLTIDTRPDDITGMRQWLTEYALPVPSRNADVIAKFISTTLISNAEWDGVRCQFIVKRPALPKAAMETDYDEWPDLTEPTSRNVKLAIGSFGLLVMLAVFLTAGVALSTHDVRPPILCYALHHVIDTTRSISTSCPAI